MNTSKFLPQGYKLFKKDQTINGVEILIAIKDCYTATEVPMADVAGEIILLN